MQHLAATDNSSVQLGTFQDWNSIFQTLSELQVPVDREEITQIENVYMECNRAAHNAFVDNHNAGYYINSYTTKLNPTMDNVLKKLLDGVRRLQGEWQASAAAKQARQEHFRRTMQVLQRFESSFRRASWKSGC